MFERLIINWNRSRALYRIRAAGSNGAGGRVAYPSIGRRTMPISRTRDKLTTFPGTLKTSDTIAVTSRGKRVLAVMSWQKYDVIRETMSILGDPALMRSLKRSLREARTGSLVSLAKVAKDLG